MFDEADARFGQRSEVRDGHDRYVNLSVGYLLGRLESYAGLAILATNLKVPKDERLRSRGIVQSAGHRRQGTDQST